MRKILFLIVILVTTFSIFAQSKKKQIQFLSSNLDSLENVVIKKSSQNDSLHKQIEDLTSEYNMLMQQNLKVEKQLSESVGLSDSCNLLLIKEKQMNIKSFNIVNFLSDGSFIGLPDLQNKASLNDIIKFSKRNVMLLEEKDGYIYTKTIPNIPWEEVEEDDEILVKKKSDYTLCYLSATEPSVPMKIKRQALSTYYENNSKEQLTFHDTVYYESPNIRIKSYFICELNDNTYQGIKRAKLICETTLNGETEKYVLLSKELGMSDIELICIGDLNGNGNVQILVSHSNVGDGYYDYLYLFSVSTAYHSVFLSHSGSGHIWLR